MRKENKTLNQRVADYSVPTWDRLLRVFRLALEEIDSPRALSVWIIAKSGNPSELNQLVFKPADYNSYDSARRAFQATELLRKYAGLPGTSPRQRETAAFFKADEAEAQCCATNRRILDWTLGSGYPAGVERTITSAQRKIIRVLGRFSLDELAKRCRWGPGSDALNKRPYVAAYHKFDRELSATKGVMPLLASILEANSLWSCWLAGRDVDGPFSPRTVFRQGNGALTVPKTAHTDRYICVEPAANIYVQLGIGKMMKVRLRDRAGIDLSDQGVNGSYARKGSKTGAWGTIDLSSASDTIARRLVALLFSHPSLTPWLRAMELSRSAFTYRKDTGWTLNHKFSSMGNGFTFELETLIFWSLASSVADELGGECPTVYGDDIIVSQGIFARVKEVLELCGFSVNTRKSYNDGYFRESCGVNSWDGIDIPVTRLEKLETLANLYSFHNGLVQLGLEKASRELVRCIPKDLRFFGPPSGGDAVLHSRSMDLWRTRPVGREHQVFHWAWAVTGLRFRALETPNRHYEPAILHSFAVMRPAGDSPLCGGYRWGSQGLATLSDGVWEVGEQLIHWSDVSTDPLHYVRG
jgi:hypothetical protein